MKNLRGKIVFLQVSHPASNSTKTKVMQVTYVTCITVVISLWIPRVEMAREWNSTSSTTGLLPRVLGSEPATPLSPELDLQQYHGGHCIWHESCFTGLYCRKYRVIGARPFPPVKEQSKRQLFPPLYHTFVDLLQKTPLLSVSSTSPSAKPCSYAADMACSIAFAILRRNLAFFPMFPGLFLQKR